MIKSRKTKTAAAIERDDVKITDDTNSKEHTNNNTPKWVFSKEDRTCPRCRGSNTEAYSTKGNIQYRRCRSPVCRKRYSVRGQKN